MGARLRQGGEAPPVYGTGSDEFTLEVHHGGFFVGHGSTRSYVDGKVACFDHCESDTWSPLWLDDFVEQLGYEKGNHLKMYWLMPGKTLADGLRFITSDGDTNVMVSVVDRVKNLVLYLDHDDHIAGLDDIVANVGEKLPQFYTNIRKRQACNLEDREVPSIHDDGDYADSEDSEFLDSDFDLDHGDDDLFADNIDEVVVDERAIEAKIRKRKKAAGSRMSVQ
ncbi:unnamed protein product [Urochloa humidicola]